MLLKCRSKFFYKICSIVLSLALLASAFVAAPLRSASADADAVINEVVAQLNAVYSYLDDEGKNAVREAKNNVLAIDVADNRWDDVLGPLLTGEVVDRLGSKADEQLAGFIRDLAAIQYTSDADEMAAALEDFKDEYQGLVAKLFGSDFTIDELYSYLLAARGEIPNAITENTDDLIALASANNYSDIKDKLKNWSKSALELAAAGGYAKFKTKLSAIGWSVDLLADRFNMLSEEVDPGFKGQIAILKAYVRSEAKFIKGSSYLDQNAAISLTKGSTLPCKLSVLGFDLAGSVLNWKTENSNVASVNNATKILEAVGTGTTTLIAYNTDPDTNWVYKATVTVTSGGGGGGGGGGAVTPTVPGTLPQDTNQANQQVQNSLQSIGQLAASDPAAAAGQMASLVQAVVQSGVALSADTVSKLSEAVKAIVQAAGQLPSSAVQAVSDGSYRLDAGAVLAQISKLASVMETLKQSVQLLAQAGAGVSLPDPVIAAPLLQPGADGKAVISVPSSAAGALAGLGSGAGLKYQTTVASLIIFAADFSAAAGKGDSVNVSFQAVADPAAAGTGMSAAGGTVDVKVFASGASGNVDIASFAHPVIMAVPYDSGVRLDTLGLYKVLGDNHFRFVGGRIMPDGTVAAKLGSLSTYTVLSYPKTFSDIAGHWAKADIEKMASRHVVQGMSESVFAPDADVTRAQFATLLLKALGYEPDAAPSGSVFSDVPKGAWYAGAVEAAYARGLVSGVGNGKFAPTEKITREQMAVMITRAVKLAGKGSSLTPAQISEALKPYADQAAVSSWAREGVAAAVKAGIVKGRTASTIVPQGKATRAEAVVMLRHFLEAADIY